jgi:hypothetical protein
MYLQQHPRVSLPKVNFYKTFYDLIISCLGKGEKTRQWLSHLWKGSKLEGFGLDGSVKIGGKKINYLEAIDHILPKIGELDTKVILFVDELPEVLHSLNKNGKKEDAESILKNIRRWRQDDEFSNFALVLAGSIGINHVVKIYNR